MAEGGRKGEGGLAPFLVPDLGLSYPHQPDDVVDVLGRGYRQIGIETPEKDDSFPAREPFVFLDAAQTPAVSISLRTSWRAVSLQP